MKTKVSKDIGTYPANGRRSAFGSGFEIVGLMKRLTATANQKIQSQSILTEEIRMKSQTVVPLCYNATIIVTAS
eukprot:gene29456-38553_t